MLKITFEYYDKYCVNGKWNTQTCIVESVKKCIELYGLGLDCNYRIISIEDLDKKE